MLCRLRRILYVGCCCKWGGPRPRENYQLGRPISPRFEPSERVAFRFYRNDVGLDGKLKAAAIRPPNQSVNRLGLGGKAWFVLLPAPDCPAENRRKQLCMGVVTIAVNQIPSGCAENKKQYLFSVEHDPLDHNYQHCEIRWYEDGHRIPSKINGKDVKLPTGVKKYYREEIANRAIVYLSARSSSKAG
jgi:hypothetical protein